MTVYDVGASGAIVSPTQAGVELFMRGHGLRNVNLERFGFDDDELEPDPVVEALLSGLCKSYAGPLPRVALATPR